MAIPFLWVFELDWFYYLNELSLPQRDFPSSEQILVLGEFLRKICRLQIVNNLVAYFTSLKR